MTTEEHVVFVRYRGAEVKIAGELMRYDGGAAGSLVMDMLDERIQASGEGCDYEYPS